VIGIGVGVHGRRLERKDDTGEVVLGNNNVGVGKDEVVFGDDTIGVGKDEVVPGPIRIDSGGSFGFNQSRIIAEVGEWLRIGIRC
jgi:hypothetical protein